jgi:serine/threonine protein kinase
MLGDFGLTTVGETTVGMMSEASINGGAGNVRYMAPERFNPASQDMRRTTAIDVYAFACVCLFVSLSSRRGSIFFVLTKSRRYTLESIPSTSARTKAVSSSKS